MRTTYRYNRPAAYPYPQQWAPRRQTARRRRQKQSLKPYLIAGAAMLAFLIPVFLVVVLLFAFNAFGLVLPGVRSGGVDIGGMTHGRAVRALDQAWNYDRKLLVTDGAHAWSASPFDFGLWVNANLTATNAQEYGRGANAAVDLGRMLSGETLSVPPVIDFRLEPARKQLERWAPLVERQPVEASLSYNNGQWAAAPGTPGAVLDIDATLLQMQADPGAVLSTGMLRLVVRPIQPQVSDLSRELAAIQALLDKPLRVRAYDPITDETVEWEASPEEMAAWLRIGNQDGSPAVEVDSQKFEQYLEGQRSRLGDGRIFSTEAADNRLTNALREGKPLNVGIYHLPSEYTVQPGDTLVSIGFDLGIPYWYIQEANPGLSAGSLSAGDTITIPSKNELLPLPVVKNKRIVISISQQRMWEYENGSLRREEVISTGIDRSPTYAGIFQVQSHELEAYASVWDLYMPHFLGIYEAVPGFMNGIHGLPTLSSGARMWVDALGRKASYGCIILTLEAAEDLYNWAEDGVVVEIQP